MVCHGEVDIEANFFPMMTAVASNAEGENSRTSVKVDDLCTIELNDVGCIFLMLSPRSAPFTV